MSWITAPDLEDKILSRHATTARVALANAWLVARAAKLGVLEANIQVTLGFTAKRAGIAYLACQVALGEAGQNQGAFDGKEQDVYLTKYKAYSAELADLDSRLTASDFSGSSDPTDQVGAISFRLRRA